jgi:hypothetical protein
MESEKHEKWIRVSEYARREGITVAAVHHRMNNRKFALETKKQYGLILIKVK